MKRRLPGLVLLFVLLALLLSATVLAEDIELNDTYVQEHKLEDTRAVPLYGGNTYKLEGDLTLDGKYLRLYPTSGSTDYNVTLDLKGHTLTIKNPVSLVDNYNPNNGVRYYDQHGSAQQEKSPIGVLVYDNPNENAAAVPLTLKDSSETKTGVLDVQGADAIGIYVGRNCTLNIEGGTITNSSYSESNQSDSLYSFGIKTVLGTVNMTGGRIEKQYAGVELCGGTFTMDDSAEIADCGYLDNNGSAWGGGVYATVGYQTENKPSDYKASTLTMDGGTIRNCMSAAGGGVYLSGSSTFTMSGGTITGCKAAYTVSSNGNGGGVYVGNGTFTMDGGTISDCEATNHGGGVFVGDGTFTMSGNAKITGCTARAGGGVSATPENGFATFTMSGNAEITDCKADGGCGGGAYIGKCKFTMSDNAKITGCTATEITGFVKDGDCILIESADSATLNIADSVTIGGQITQGFGGIRIDGLGSAKYPYQIGDKDELVLFGSIVNGTAKGTTSGVAVPAQRGACAELTADIDLENAEWMPIGQNTGSLEDTLAYSGTFNGNGHTISGLNVTGNFNYSGLFGYTQGATIRNLTVAGKVTSTSTDSSTAVGGIIGRAKGSTIENCGNLCAVTAPAGHTGGIVGYAAYMKDASGSITACYNAGKISGGDYAGGIVGTCYDEVYIYDCYNVGAVSGNRAIGGIAGNSGSARLFNCYNAGTAVSPVETATLGGLIGSGVGHVYNSYYLKGTTADPKATEMSTEEFADGTVLNLLINGRAENEHPWAEKCQYVDAAKLTLPVFKNQNTHEHDLIYVPAKEPTTSADGNIEYWYCKICGKYFSDAEGNNEITEADTILKQLPYPDDSGDSGIVSSSHIIHASAGTGGSITPDGSTSVQPGKDQTFTITPDAGYVVCNVRVDGRSVSAVTRYTFENVRASHTIEAFFARRCAFADVPAGSYYEGAVSWAVANGITTGADASHFAPDGICTRAQAVAFLWRAAGSPTPTGSMPFADVKPGSYYYNAVLWAVESGIASGTSATAFSPDAPCTRAQIAAFIWRAAKFPPTGGTVPFTDVNAGAYYADAVAWAAMTGVTTGTGGSRFSPDAPCTRAQIVTFICRAFAK